MFARLGVLAAVCAEEGRRTAAATIAPGARHVGGLPEALDDGIDDVVVSTPSSSHTPVTPAALRVGKHVLVEKPLDLSAGDAARPGETRSSSPRHLHDIRRGDIDPDGAGNRGYTEHSRALIDRP